MEEINCYEEHNLAQWLGRELSEMVSRFRLVDDGFRVVDKKFK